MLQNIVLSTVTSLSILTSSALVGSFGPQPTLIAEHDMSLDKRYNNQFVNDVFKDNILLDLAYLQGNVKKSQDINWDEIRKPFIYKLRLDPEQTFAFHDSLLDEYKGKVNLTTNAHFNNLEGFKSDGYLIGDGVCHLASLINWAARDAKLEVNSPTNHNFANIPEVPKQYGVSIYSQAGPSISTALQNLYITNNKNQPVIFKFTYQDNNLKVSVYTN